MRVTTSAEWTLRRDALLDSLREFASIMRHRPFDNEQGLRGVSAFALYWFIRRVVPGVVLEVGVWRGFSTWLIEQAAPAAEIHCFDPLFTIEHLIPNCRIGRTSFEGSCTAAMTETPTARPWESSRPSSCSTSVRILRSPM
jgi:hypothetical protein